MRKIRRLTKFVVAFLLLGVAAAVVPPAAFLASVWWRDGSTPLADAGAGTDDASRMNANQPLKVVAIASDPIEAERQLAALIRDAAAQGNHIAISGAHHSMGGHTFFPGAIVLDMLPFKRMSLDAEKRILTVGAGARWADIIPFLDQRGLSIAVMQSNNDFSVGGSLSVNCHGWQNDSPPISSTVESLRIVTASGSILRCSRNENPELFSLALGGYGLFGVILEADLRVVPNEFYVAEPHRVSPADYDRVYHELTRDLDNVGMAYGRISVAPNSFLQEAIITLLKRQRTDRSVSGTLANEKPSRLNRVVFRGSANSDYGKNLRWRLEKFMGETGGKLLSRNQILNEPASLYATRDPDSTDILHEYFIPCDRLGEFIDLARSILSRNHPDLLNITVRNVMPDRDTFLRYARREVFGLVLLFNQRRDADAEAAMQALTRELIDAALVCGGSYYLPYRPHATRDQFLQAYSQAPEFFEQKLRFDPAGVFENTFYRNYGKPVANESATHR